MNSIKLSSVINYVLQTIAILFAVLMWYEQQYAISVAIVIPLFMVDILLKFFINGKPYASVIGTIGNILKLLLLIQLLMVFLLTTNSLFFDAIKNPLLGNQINQAVLKQKHELFEDNIEQTPSKHDPLINKKMHENSRDVSNNKKPMIDKIAPLLHLNPRKALENEIHPSSHALLASLFGEIIHVHHPDLEYRSSKLIKSRLPRIFNELPADISFDKNLKNPCWVDDEGAMQCLPYAYVLGQPKCGTSDLYERLKRHEMIRMPERKEVRWFTRGEFTTEPILHEGDENNEENVGFGRHEMLLGPESSIFSFTRAFRLAAEVISEKRHSFGDSIITIDGGPHTFWPTQGPDGTLFPKDIPPPQIIREIQPNAKFILTLSDPVQRMYSDYYFLGDNLRPVRPDEEGNNNEKSARQFHDRVLYQTNEFRKCVDNNKSFLEDIIREKQEEFLDLSNSKMKNQIFLRASQVCAHDRHRFAVGGWGRISIGLYSLYLEKWLEHFSPDQFLVLRLEDYSTNPKAYLMRVFDFLQVGEPEEWLKLIENRHFNEYIGKREPILAETEVILRDFYRPYNELLVAMLDNDESFLWESYLHDMDGNVISLHDNQINKEIQKQNSIKNHEFPVPLRRDVIPHHRNQHDPARHLDVNLDRNLNKPLEPPLDIRHPDNKMNNLRTNPRKIRANNQNIKLNKMSFSIENLTQDLNYGEFFDPELFSIEDDDYGQKLCEVSFTLDLAAIKYLLYDTGVPSSSINKYDFDRNALHCLALIHLMADAQGKSHIFSLLKGEESWISPYLNPPMNQQLNSVLAQDILVGLSMRIVHVAEWLLRADTPINCQDRFGNSPLHLAASGGQLALSKLLVNAGANVNLLNYDHRTAAHYAATNGHAEILSLLNKANSDFMIEDMFGTKVIDIIHNPGPILPNDALLYFNITQRKAKQIQRVLHPENFPLNSTDSGPDTGHGPDGKVGSRQIGWIGGNGGWGLERLKGFEDDMLCDAIDQYWADEITGEEIFHNYIARNTPILIRGLFDHWEAKNIYKQDSLSSLFGDMRVEVSDIPYAHKFGGKEPVHMLLSEYIEEVKYHRMVGGSHPWYVFRGHPIPSMSERDDSFVQYPWCPSPKSIIKAYEFINPPESRGQKGVKAREIFINAQWALGGEGTGAPVHFHNSAWNALVYGAKKWVIYPPHNMIMSNKQILDYYETDMVEFLKRGVPPVTCVQTAGDVLIIPESWAHGVLNIQESVAIASESKEPACRVKPGSRLIQIIPLKNRE
eukprot:gene8159-11043_t